MKHIQYDIVYIQTVSFDSVINFGGFISFIYEISELRMCFIFKYM